MIMAEFMKVLVTGRTECYVKKSSSYNPYVPGDKYDWDFELACGDYIFTDSYRGFNPYSGVEYVYTKDQKTPIWSCDYVGYALANTGISEKEIYGFLKRGRSRHLLDCAKDPLIDFSYKDGDFDYKTRFSGELKEVLQIEEIYYHGKLVGMQTSAGYLKE